MSGARMGLILDDSWATSGGGRDLLPLPCITAARAIIDCINLLVSFGNAISILILPGSLALSISSIIVSSRGYCAILYSYLGSFSVCQLPVVVRMPLLLIQSRGSRKRGSRNKHLHVQRRSQSREYYLRNEARYLNYLLKTLQYVFYEVFMGVVNQVETPSNRLHE